MFILIIFSLRSRKLIYITLSERIEWEMPFHKISFHFVSRYLIRMVFLGSFFT